MVRRFFISVSLAFNVYAHLFFEFVLHVIGVWFLFFILGHLGFPVWVKYVHIGYVLLINITRLSYGVKDGYCYLEHGIVAKDLICPDRYPYAEDLVARGYVFDVYQVDVGLWHPVDYSKTPLPPVIIPLSECRGIVGSYGKPYSGNSPFTYNNGVVSYASDYARNSVNSALNTNVGLPTRNWDQVARNVEQLAGTRTNGVGAFARALAGNHHAGLAVATDINMRWDAPGELPKPSINTASAMASARILIGSDGLQGEFGDNKLAAMEVFEGKAVTTALNPSSKRYRRLVELLGVPLQYNPKIKEHDAAGTCRRAWVKTMLENTRFGRIGMIAPSLNEWHHNPTAVAYYNGEHTGVDKARFDKPCGRCQARRCRVYMQAKLDGRVAFNISSAAYLFKMYGVDYLWMVNIEPNIAPVDVLYLMVKANIHNGYSAVHIDWNAVFMSKSYCDITGQETTRRGDHVISKFGSSGTYLQSYDRVRAFFSPTFSNGAALRRTIVGRAGTSMLLELNVDYGGVGTSFIPDMWQYYLIPVPHPTEGVIHFKVEREGFDRVLQLYRTLVNRNVDAARIQLRQSNVTYSVSGTALTPRLKLDATCFELLALWMTSYSAIMDEVMRVGSIAVDREVRNITDGTIKKVSSSIYGAVTSKILANSDETNPQFGSQSSIRRWLSVCEADGRFLTLEEISDKAYQSVYGHGYATDTGVNMLKSKYAHLFAKIPGVYQSISYLGDLSRVTWRKGFDTFSVLMHALIMTGKAGKEATGFAMDISIHMCRVLGVDHSPLTRTRRFLDTIDVPIAKTWIEIVESQRLGFQAASIEIVEALINNFSPQPDLLAVMTEARDKGLVPDSEEVKAMTQTMADIPYTRFMSELKVLLGSYNSRSKSISQMNNLLNVASERRNSLPKETQDMIDRLIADSKELISSLPENEEEKKVLESVFNVSFSQPNMLDLPIPVVSPVKDTLEPMGMSISANQAFDGYHTIDLDADNVVDRHRYLKRLPVRDGKLDFGEIHEKMEANVPGAATAGNYMDVHLELGIGPNRLTSPFSPDKIGGKFLSNIAKKVAAMMALTKQFTAPFATDEEIVEWCRSRSDTTITAVSKSIRSALTRMGNHRVPFIMHIDGLAMGGKSAGIRDWIHSDDCVVVPSRKLREEWIENLGKLDPTKRASVYTQHTALVQDCARFIIIDEVFTFETPHLELLRRFPNAKGVITIGDAHQIRDVFAEGTSTFDPTATEPAFTAIAPVSFVPYDCLVQYLRMNRSMVYCDMYYSGTTVRNGLKYTVDADQIVLPSDKDTAINGLQNTKASLIARGLSRAITTHESQGSRAEWTFVHITEAGLGCPDMNFLGNNPRHFGVTITRARKGTCFIAKDKASVRSIPGVDVSMVNGTALPDDMLYAGTTFDLIDPVTQEDVTFERVENQTVPVTGNEYIHAQSAITVGSFEANGEAIAKEQIIADVDVACASIVNTNEIKQPSTTDETMLFNPASVPGAGLINMIERRTNPTTITDAHFRVAEKIVARLFDKIVDPYKFHKLAELSKSSIKAQTRDQVLKMADSSQSTKSDTVSFAFPKNEPAKKLMTIGKGLKILSVTAMNQTQLQLFGDAAAILTHAWSRSLRHGIISPVGFTKPEIARVLGSFTHSWEIDLEKQDSTHSAVHVAVFLILLGIVAKRQGMVELAKEIRQARTIGDMQGTMRIMMGTGLGSGDIWTLIANKIMAMSVLVSLYDVPHTKRMLQVGDDITADRKFKKHKNPLSGSEGVTLKIIDNSLSGRPSFTSNVSISPDLSIAARVRGIIKMAFSPRNRTQHVSYKVECEMLKNTVASVGILEYCDVYQALFGAEPSFTEFIIHEAIRLANIPFDDLDEKLKLHTADEKKCVLHSREHGCFGWALSHVVSGNVKALNALTKYSGPVPKSVAAEVCATERVRYVVYNSRYSGVGAQKCVDDFLKKGDGVGTVYIFDDHAISITSISAETITFGGTHRYRINLVTNQVDELDFL